MKGQNLISRHGNLVHLILPKDVEVGRKDAVLDLVLKPLSESLWLYSGNMDLALLYLVTW